MAILLLSTAIQSCSLFDNVDARKLKLPISGPPIIYENPDYKIQIQYPNNWMKSETNLAGHQIVRFLAPDAEEKETRLSTTVFTPAIFSMAAEPVLASTSLDRYIDKFIKETYPNISDYKLINSTNSRLNEIPAKQVFMYDYRNNQVFLTMRIFSIDRDNAYRLTYYAPPGTFANYLQTANQMINSFKILK